MDRVQHTRVTDEYERLKRRYTTAVRSLFDIGYQVPDSEYRMMRNQIEILRIDLDRARLEAETDPLTFV